MTGHELSKLKGMDATLQVPDRALGTVEVPVRIMDTRTSYGRDELLVTAGPLGTDFDEHLAEHGQAWVSADRVKVRDTR